MLLNVIVTTYQFFYSLLFHFNIFSDKNQAQSEKYTDFSQIQIPSGYYSEILLERSHILSQIKHMSVYQLDKQDFLDHDIKLDPEYSQIQKFFSEEEIKNFPQLIHKISKNYSNFYIKIEKNETHGIYSTIKYKKRKTLGFILGVITKDQNIGFSYPYPSKIYDQQLYIDSQYSNTILTYLTHDKEPNCSLIYLPIEGIWSIMVIAIRDIKPGEKITINSFKNNQFDQDEKIEITNKILFTYLKQQIFKNIIIPQIQKKQDKKFKHFQLHQNISNQELYKLNITYLEDYQIQDQDTYNFIQNYDTNQESHINYYTNKVNIKTNPQFIFHQNSEIDSLIFASFIDENIGFSVFAKKFLPINTVLGYYTGILSIQPESGLYIWDLQMQNQNKQQLIINANNSGNLLRFVNDYDEYNLRPIYQFEQNCTKIYYVTNQDIQIGQELSISYGSQYWSSFIKYSIQISKYHQLNNQTLNYKQSEI